MKTFILLFLISTSLAWSDVNGLMQPYSKEGNYPIANGQAAIVIQKDARGRLQYEIKTREGGTTGNPDFIKSARFFVFPEDVDHYWVYDGKSDISHFVIREGEMMCESLSCVPSHFQAMPKEAVALLPEKVRKEIK